MHFHNKSNVVSAECATQTFVKQTDKMGCVIFIMKGACH